MIHQAALPEKFAKTGMTPTEMFDLRGRQMLSQPKMLAPVRPKLARNLADAQAAVAPDLERIDQ